MNLEFVTLKWMTEFSERVQDAQDFGCAVVLAGEAGSGKREYLQRLCDEPGRKLIRFQEETKEFDTMGYLRQIIEEISPNMLPRDWRRRGIAFMVKHLAMRLHSYDIKLLAISNCHLVNHELYNVLFDVMALSKSRNHVCGLVISGRGEKGVFETQTKYQISRIRQIREVPKLTHGDVSAMVEKWCGKHGAELANQAENETSEKKCREAVDTLNLIFGHTEGLVGRLAMFCMIKLRSYGNRPFSKRLVGEILADLQIST